MASRLKLSTAVSAFIFICATVTTAQTLSSPPLTSPEIAPAPSLSSSDDLASILSNLGFQELAKAVDDAATPLTEPSTVFALSDASVRSCASCSVPRLLGEHTVPGLFPLHYLRKLPFGIKLETVAPGRCVTVTFAGDFPNEKIFLGGVEMTRPNLFDNGLIVVHGIEGFASHLSRFSCSAAERFVAPQFPVHRSPSPPSTAETAEEQFTAPPASPVMRMMLRDAVVRLRIAGYSIVALALKVKFKELVVLQNMTIFALDDASILSSGHAYVSNVRFHIVPNWFLSDLDLQRLPATAVLSTLEPGQSLEVTNPGGGPEEPMKINYVSIKSFDVMHNLKISVHGISFPFPHLHPPSAGAFSGNGELELSRSDAWPRVACGFGDLGSCDVEPPMPSVDHQRSV